MTVYPKFFDAAWYGEVYPDVAASGMAPRRHYLRYGRYEGRRACAVLAADRERDFLLGLLPLGQIEALLADPDPAEQVWARLALARLALRGPDLRPKAAPDLPPSGGSGLATSAALDLAPSGGLGLATSGGPDLTSLSAPGLTLRGGPGLMPSGASGRAPRGGLGWAPSAAADLPTGGGPDLTPERGSDWRSFGDAAQAPCAGLEVLASGAGPAKGWQQAQALLAPLSLEDLAGFGLLGPVLLAAEAALVCGAPERAARLLRGARRWFGWSVRAQLRGLSDWRELALARANLAPSTAAWRRRLLWPYLSAGHLPPRLLGAPRPVAPPASAALPASAWPVAAAAFDRLAPPLAWPRRGGPLVSVLMPARNAADTIDTALWGLRQQSWKTLEILVIDNGSQDATAARVAVHAAADPRIRLLDGAAASGAYEARNLGLAAARGAFITTHDADDWAHPARIARHIRALLRQPSLMATLSHFVRATSDLRLTRWWGGDRLAHPNMSSLMFRRQVLDELGFWDRVRGGGDSEYLARIRAYYGDGSVRELARGLPLSFGRQTEGSLSQASATSVQTLWHGARRDYALAAAAWHRESLAAGQPPYLPQFPGARPFWAPQALLAQSIVLPDAPVAPALVSTSTSTSAPAPALGSARGPVSSLARGQVLSSVSSSVSAPVSPPVSASVTGPADIGPSDLAAFAAAPERFPRPAVSKPDGAPRPSQAPAPGAWQRLMTAAHFDADWRRQAVPSLRILGQDPAEEFWAAATGLTQGMAGAAMTLTEANLTDSSETDTSETGTGQTGIGQTGTGQTGTGLRGAHLTDTHLTEANLTGTGLKNTRLPDTRLPDTRLAEASLLLGDPGPRFSLSGYALKLEAQAFDDAAGAGQGGVNLGSVDAQSAAYGRSWPEALLARLQDPAPCLPDLAGALGDTGAPRVMLFAHRAGAQVFGAERSFLDMLDRVAAAGLVPLAVLPSAGSADYRAAVLARCHRLYIRPYFWRYGGFAPPRETVDLLAEVIKDSRAAEVHVNTLVLDAPLAAAQQAGVPATIWVRELAGSDPQLCRDLSLHPEALRLMLRGGGARLIANSAQVAAWLRGGDEAPSDADAPITLMPNPVDPALFLVPAPDLAASVLPASDLSARDVPASGLPVANRPAPDLPAPEFPVPNLPAPDLPAPLISSSGAAAPKPDVQADQPMPPGQSAQPAPQPAPRRRARIGLIGSLSARKGLIEMVALARSLPQADFVLIGPDSAELSALRQARRLPLNLQHLGYIADPAAALAQVDLVLSLSRVAESYGRTVAEALAAGRPVICWDHGAPSDLVGRGGQEAGLVVALRDLPGLRAAVLALLHPSRFARASAAARARAQDLAAQSRAVTAAQLFPAALAQLGREAAP